MKAAYKMVFALYLLFLLWLVLFKFSFDISTVLLEHQARSLNLVPFAGHLRETIDNLVVFIPFGLLLSVIFKQIALWRKLAVVFIFSLVVETLQFALAIGVTDITDVITNTLGGLVGLVLYSFGKKHVDDKKLDGFIVIAGTLLLIVFILLRVFVFRVRY